MCNLLSTDGYEIDYAVDWLINNEFLTLNAIYNLGRSIVPHTEVNVDSPASYRDIFCQFLVHRVSPYECDAVKISRCMSKHISVFYEYHSIPNNYREGLFDQFIILSPYDFSLQKYQIRKELLSHLSEEIEIPALDDSYIDSNSNEMETLDSD